MVLNTRTDMIALAQANAVRYPFDRNDEVDLKFEIYLINCYIQKESLDYIALQLALPSELLHKLPEAAYLYLKDKAMADRPTATQITLHMLWLWDNWDRELNDASNWFRGRDVRAQLISTYRSRMPKNPSW
jgi:hypothetical protein